MRPCVLSIVSVACSADQCCPLYCILFKNFPLCQTKCRTRGIRTPNLLIRSQTPYPLGHAAVHPVNQLYLLFVQLPIVVPCLDSISKTFLLQAISRPQEVFEPPIFLYEVRRPIRWAMRPCVLSIVSVACSAAKCCPLYCILFKNFPLCQTKCRPRGIRTLNLLVRSHALSVGPCRHVYCQFYLLLVHSPSVVPCNDSISKKFPLCQAKCRPQRDSNPQSSDSKSDALFVGPCRHVFRQLYLLLVQLPSDVPCIDVL